MSHLNILVANNHLVRVGGSETFTFTLIKELINQGHRVEYFTFEKGEISILIEQELQVNFMSQNNYDLILANHNTCIKHLFNKGKIIQTCHGIFPDLEQPSIYADGHVAISHEVLNHITEKGFNGEIIHNGIDCVRYKPVKPLHKKLTKVLSLCHSKEANNTIKHACDGVNASLIILDKYNKSIWDVERIINEVDLVVGLGRSAYEAMACGRTVVIYDNRHYFTSFADGYVTPKNIDNFILNNCSGRFSEKEFTTDDLIAEFKKYDHHNGIDLRKHALKELNIKTQVSKYIQYADRLTNKKTFKQRKEIFKLNTKFLTNLPYILFSLKKWCERYLQDEITREDYLFLKSYILEYKLLKEDIINFLPNIDTINYNRKRQIWNHYLENTLPKKQSNPNFTLSNNPSLTNVIVEAREHPHFKVVVENILINTQHLNIGLIVYHGTENEKFVKDALKEFKNILFINLNLKNIDIEGYNKIMLSKEFIETIPTDKFLVFQTDVITFKSLDKKFLEYDYIGAPWKKEFHKEYKAEVGNGGLSIRSKKAMLKILELDIERIKNQPEDLYLAQILKSQNFKVAPYEVAFEFATEDVYNPNAFGCHKSWELIKTRELKELL